MNSTVARSISARTASWTGSRAPSPADMSKTLPFRKSNTPAEISRPMICFW